MKIISVPRINALGLKGPEEMGEKVLTELGVDAEIIEIDNSDVEKSEKVIYERAKEIFEGLDVPHPPTLSGRASHSNVSKTKQLGSISKEDNRVVFIGGDHSISYPIFKAFSEINEDAFLIVFDAHADCMPPMAEPTHEEWLRAVIRDGFDSSRVILVGVRKVEDVEKKFLEERGVKVFTDIFDVEAVADYITEKANGKAVYVSVDVDVLDPAFAPGVSYPEPNGLSPRELFYLLKRIFCIKSLLALDVVEVVPPKDEKYDYRTVKVAAKVVSEFVGD